jgi:hypothetical protein
MIWTYPAPAARAQEPQVSKDSDGDGLVDFDENERFRTAPNNKDSDKDGVPDKEDIESTRRSRPGATRLLDVALLKWRELHTHCAHGVKLAR